MKVKAGKETEWSQFQANQRDYGAYVVCLAVRWADLVEHQISENRLVDVELARQQASVPDGLTYGAARAILTEYWHYSGQLQGEALSWVIVAVLAAATVMLIALAISSM